MEEFVNGTVRGMGQAAGTAWYASKWLYIVIILVILYYFHTNPHESMMMRMDADAPPAEWKQFVGKWYAGKHVIEFGALPKRFRRDDLRTEIEDPVIYSFAGTIPKVRFEVELSEGTLSHVFMSAHNKYISVSIDGGKATTYWKDKRKASRDNKKDKK